MTKTVKLTLEFTWEITEQEWAEGKEFWKDVLIQKAQYDPISIFYYLRQIKNPEPKTIIHNT
jgi:hypothetical protein